ncbi:hypothetical protein BGX34_006955 [Mortierella sp. NVP85]|nr:hypothetical protein BGX34_006955 [Mortierella sp. NVP85]
MSFFSFGGPSLQNIQDILENERERFYMSTKAVANLTPAQCEKELSNAISALDRVRGKGALKKDQTLKDNVDKAYTTLKKLQGLKGNKVQESVKFAEEWRDRMNTVDRTSSAPSYSQFDAYDDSDGSCDSSAPYIFMVDSDSDDSSVPYFFMADADSDDSSDSNSVQSYTAVRKTDKHVLGIASLSQHIFIGNSHHPIELKPPGVGERLNSVPQLAYCLGLLQTTLSLDSSVTPETRRWFEIIMKNPDEQERLKKMGRDVVTAYKSSETKGSEAIAEVLYLAPVLEDEAFQDLLKEFFYGVQKSSLSDITQLEGLAQLIQRARPGQLSADDFGKIMELFGTHLRKTQSQSLTGGVHKQITVVSCLLDAIADVYIKEDLDRLKLHEPLSLYIGELKGSSDPYLVYQAAYVHQALLCVLDDEAIWKSAMQSAENVVQRVTRLGSATSGFDLDKFTEGLEDIQKRIVGVSELAKTTTTTTAYEKATAWARSGQDFMDNLKEGSTLDRKPAKALLEDLRKDGDAEKQEHYRLYLRNGPDPYPLKVIPHPPTPSIVLDDVQDRLYVERRLKQLRADRLKVQVDVAYIPLQAKASLGAAGDIGRPLMEMAQEFLGSQRKVFLLIGGSGSGKSTFSRELESSLWSAYKPEIGQISLHITLPAIDRPERDMIDKQLQKLGFDSRQILEIKRSRKLALICDGYDDTLQTHNLHMDNLLDQLRQWSAQMIITCCSNYLTVGYRDRFLRLSDPSLFQEALITPFTFDQVETYIKRYLSVRQSPWSTKDYMDGLERIPGLKELVMNPFMAALYLKAPYVVHSGQSLSAIDVTRVVLYDYFVERWWERGMEQLREKNSDLEAFKKLSQEGFTNRCRHFLKKLSVAIYREQNGHPIVKYSPLEDKNTWKAEFFDRKDETRLLLESCPLTRNGALYRFIHRSLLEYGLTLARDKFEY